MKVQFSDDHQAADIKYDPSPCGCYRAMSYSQTLFSSRSMTDEVPPPASYTSNSRKEQQALDFVRNFERQFRVLYGQRKPLLLTAPNEFVAADEKRRRRRRRGRDDGVL